MLHTVGPRRLLLTVVAAMTLGALLVAPLSASAQGTDPETVIRSIIDAINAKDTDAALSLVADDAVITILPPPPTLVFTGKEEIRGWWEVWATDNGYAELSDFQVAGDRATWSAKISIDDWRGMGVAPLDFEGEGIVQDGLLKAYTFTMTDESIATIEAAVAALPETGVSPASPLLTHSWALALGILAVLGALAVVVPLRVRRRAA